VNDEVVIRAGRDEDGEQLCALIAPIFAEYDGVIFDLEEMPELGHIATAFARDCGAFWSAFRGQQLVGCVGWTPAKLSAGAPKPAQIEAPRGVELKKLYVALSERGRGLGGVLCERVEEAARAQSASFVDLWSDVKFDTAHRFYERRGYQRDGRTRALGDRSNTVEYYFRKML